MGYFDFDIGKRQAEEEVKEVTSKKQKVDDEVAAKQKVLKVVKISSEESFHESEDVVLYFNVYICCYEFNVVDPVFVCYCNVIDLCHVIDRYIVFFIVFQTQIGEIPHFNFEGNYYSIVRIN